MSTYEDIAWDAEQDAMMESIYDGFRSDPGVRESFVEELYDEIVQDFTATRLQTLYQEQPDIASAAKAALDEARALLAHSPRAALILACTAAEVAFRRALLQPVVYGLVHTPSSAPLIAELAIGQKDEGFLKVLCALLHQHGGVDLRSLRRTGSNKPLWEEMKDCSKKRNQAVHAAATVQPDDASLAIEVAAHLIEEVFPAVVQNLGLHLHGLRPCSGFQCAPKAP